MSPGSRIIGTAEEGYVYKRQAAHGCFNDPYVQAFFPAYLVTEVAGQSEATVEANGTAHGGHLMEAHVRPTLEVILVESPQHLRRQTDAESGLALIRL